VKAFVLLVTWFVQGQPPSSYQTAFSSSEACEAARAAVFADGNRLRQTIYDDAINKVRGAGLPDNMAAAAAALPSLTAVCVAQ
jgi:hypothetical protein